MYAFSGNCLEPHAEAGKHADVIARFCIATAGKRLEPRDVVTRLDANPNAMDTNVDTNRAVPVDVRLRVDVQVAVAVGSAANASVRIRPLWI